MLFVVCTQHSIKEVLPVSKPHNVLDEVKAPGITGVAVKSQTAQTGGGGGTHTQKTFKFRPGQGHGNAMRSVPHDLQRGVREGGGGVRRGAWEWQAHGMACTTKCHVGGRGQEAPGLQLGPGAIPALGSSRAFHTTAFHACCPSAWPNIHRDHQCLRVPLTTPPCAAVG